MISLSRSNKVHNLDCSSRDVSNSFGLGRCRIVYVDGLGGDLEDRSWITRNEDEDTRIPRAEDLAVIYRDHDISRCKEQSARGRFEDSMVTSRCEDTWVISILE